MSGYKSIPRFRFRSLEMPYTTYKLKNLASFFKGKGYSKNDLVSSGYPIILYGRMYTDYKLNIKNITDTFVKDDIESFKSKQGDVIIPASGETAKDISIASNIEEKGIIIGGDLNVIRPNRTMINSTFLALNLSNGKLKKELVKKAQGKSIVHIHNTDLMDLYISLPSIPEQQKIGTFFAKLDQLLDLQQQKLDQLELLKKVLLQKLFPNQGAKIPELRFKGFEEEWKKEKLGNIITWNKGKELSKKYLNLNKAGTPVIHYADLYKFAEVTSKTIHWSTYNQGNAIPSNSILFPSSDVTPTGLARTTAVTCVGIRAGGDVIIGVLNKKVYNVFMSYQINKNHKQILRLVSGTSIKHVNSHDLSRLYEYITDYNEQQKIAVLFAKIDRLIELQNKKFDNLKQVKKSLLQNMFVE